MSIKRVLENALGKWHKDIPAHKRLRMPVDSVWAKDLTLQDVDLIDIRDSVAIFAERGEGESTCYYVNADAIIGVSFDPLLEHPY